METTPPGGRGIGIPSEHSHDVRPLANGGSGSTTADRCSPERLLSTSANLRSDMGRVDCPPERSASTTIVKGGSSRVIWPSVSISYSIRIRPPHGELVASIGPDLIIGHAHPSTQKSSARRKQARFWCPAACQLRLEAHRWRNRSFGVGTATR